MKGFEEKQRITLISSPPLYTHNSQLKKCVQISH